MLHSLDWLYENVNDRTAETHYGAGGVLISSI